MMLVNLISIPITQASCGSLSIFFFFSLNQLLALCFYSMVNSSVCVIFLNSDLNFGHNDKYKNMIFFNVCCSGALSSIFSKPLSL